MEPLPSHRLRLREVRRSGTTVHVRLDLHSRSVEGADDSDDAHLAAGEATLSALGRLAPTGVELQLDRVRILDAAEGLPAQVAVLVTVTLGAARLRHAGSSIVTESTDRAVAAAVLAALNRRLEVLGI